MPQFEHLEWDSGFFGKKVGRITLGPDTPAELPATLLGQAREEGYGLVYLFHAPELHITPEVMGEFKGRVVPSRTELGLELHPTMHAGDPGLQSFPRDAEWRELMDLGRSSGRFSRFFLDPQISRQDYERLYDTWVERSVRREIADEVFVYRTGNELKGFVTVSIKDEIATIGLIAVGDKWSGKGVATKLVQAACDHGLHHGATEIRVVTQQENRPAMGLYAKFGFRILHLEQVKHFL